MCLITQNFSPKRRKGIQDQNTVERRTGVGSLTVVKAKFIALLDISAREERDVGEPEILVLRKHLHRDDIRPTGVIDESGEVCVPVGVDAKGLSILQRAASLNRETRIDRDHIFLTLLSKSKR